MKTIALPSQLRDISFTFITVIIMAFASLSAAHANDPILIVKGKVTGAPHVHSHETLNRFNQHTIRTTTDWTDGITEFQGPLARDILTVAEGAGDTVRAVAVNDYAVEIPMSDFWDYDVILATSMNGQPLSLRDKGPIWVVYPRDEHPELQSVEHNDKWIWQLKEIIVK
ncbi:MAG: molybdopterin-dependent oxidoreductase [Alphaproteobacteria bacterium]|nr:molybdopterin-dependent oxidoreductase [Alphaproteobacteria bacterium SS10]